nr:hypothetical protein GCM10020185_76020 [Pseudomonas brassicacearum subsp. brassicacearum]
MLAKSEKNSGLPCMAMPALLTRISICPPEGLRPRHELTYLVFIGKIEGPAFDFEPFGAQFCDSIIDSRTAGGDDQSGSRRAKPAGDRHADSDLASNPTDECHRVLSNCVWHGASRGG